MGGSSVLSFISRHLDPILESDDNGNIDNDNKNSDNYNNDSNDDSKISKNVLPRNVLRRNGKKEVLIIAIEENSSVMEVRAENLLNEKINKIDSSSNNSNDSYSSDNLYRNVVYVRSYAECAGVLAAHKAGILLSSITSHVPKINVRKL